MKAWQFRRRFCPPGVRSSSGLAASGSCCPSYVATTRSSSSATSSRSSAAAPCSSTLYAAGRLEGRRVGSRTSTPISIGCYRAVRDEADAVIAALRALAEEHRARGSACYYDVRDRRFNPLRAGLGADAAAGYTPALAAMLIYLNRTGYNGLFRLNRSGAFNVPVGRYTDPRISDPEHIRNVASGRSQRRTCCSNASGSTTRLPTRVQVISCTATRRTRRSAGPPALRNTRRAASARSTIVDCRQRSSPPPVAAPSSSCRTRAHRKSKRDIPRSPPGWPASYVSAFPHAARSTREERGADLSMN